LTNSEKNKGDAQKNANGDDGGGGGGGGGGGESFAADTIDGGGCQKGASTGRFFELF